LALDRSTSAPTSGDEALTDKQDRIAAIRGDLNRQSVSEQVVSVLREEILRGTLPPGSALPEVALAQSFGVSRNTVREAIRLLVHEGLARHHMHRGAVVTAQTEADLVDIHRARAAVELAAVATAATATAEQLAGLDALVDHMAAAVEAGDGRAVDEADLAFHRGLVSLLGSTRLDQFYEGLQRELRLGFTTMNRRLPHPDRVTEHRRLAQLATARDVEALRLAVAGPRDETWSNQRRAFDGDEPVPVGRP
jgi:DNA-binding GntR family transcriptional regulator